MSLPSRSILLLAWIASMAAMLVMLFVELMIVGELRIPYSSSTASIVALLAASCVVSLTVATVVSMRLSSMLRTIESATAVIAAGGFDHRLAIDGNDAIGSLCASIDSMAQRLQDSELSRRRMLATVSHELRTPLTVMRGEAFTLSRVERDVARIAKYQMIDAEAERLAALIDDLLIAATLKASRINLAKENVDVDELVDAVASRFHRVAADKNVILESNVGVRSGELNVDRRRFDQIMGNLVSNALAHSPKLSKVEIRADRRATSVRFSISNTGPDIDQETMSTIFEPFEQGKQPTGSVGLGLAIARDLVRAHGGDLAVRSRNNKTTFWFDIPSGRIRTESMAKLRMEFAR